MTLLGLHQHLQEDAGRFLARIQVFASAKNIWGSSQLLADQGFSLLIILFRKVRLGKKPCWVHQALGYAIP